MFSFSPAQHKLCVRAQFQRTAEVLLLCFESRHTILGGTAAAFTLYCMRDVDVRPHCGIAPLLENESTYMGRYVSMHNVILNFRRIISLGKGGGTCSLWV
jgi:hypothetical protein